MQENKNENYEIGEEATRYGEFITSYFCVVTTICAKREGRGLRKYN